MTFNLGGDGRIFLHPGDDLVEADLGVLGDFEGIPLEEGNILEEGVDFSGLALDVRFLTDVDGIADNLLAVNILDDLLVDILDSRDRLAAEVEGEAYVGAEEGTRSALAGVEGLVAHSSILDIRNDADNLTECDRESDTDTAGGGAVVNLHITGVDVRDDVLVDAEENVTVEVGEGLLVEIIEGVAGLHARVTETETGEIVEPFTGIDIDGVACAAVGVHAVDILLAVIAEVQTTACSGEPVVLDVLTFLAESGEACRNGESYCKESLEFHIFTVLLIIRLEMADDAKGEGSTQVERETGVTFAAFMVELGRTEAVELVGKGFTAEIGKDAEAVAEVVLADTTETKTEDIVRVGDILLLPRVMGVCQVEGTAIAEAGIALQAERAVKLGEGADIEDEVGECRDALKTVRIETAAALPGIGCSCILAESNLDAGTEGLGEVITDGDGRLRIEQVHGLAVLKIGEVVLVDREEDTALDREAQLPGVVRRVLRKKCRCPDEQGSTACDKFLHKCYNFYFIIRGFRSRSDSLGKPQQGSPP